MDIDLARAWVQAIAVAVGRHKDHLTQLDSAIGDADHGTNLDRGFSAAAAVVADLDAETVGAVLTRTGTALISSTGGASGPLYGAAFRALGKSLDVPVADQRAFAAALAAGLESIRKLGRRGPLVRRVGIPHHLHGAAGALPHAPLRPARGLRDEVTLHRRARDLQGRDVVLEPGATPQALVNRQCAATS